MERAKKIKFELIWANIGNMLCLGLPTDPILSGKIQIGRSVKMSILFSRLSYKLKVMTDPKFWKLMILANPTKNP